MSFFARRRCGRGLWGAAALGVAVVLAAGTCGLAAGVASGVAAAATPASRAGPAGSVYYVDVGASESLGVQPSETSRTEVPTDQGYANALVDLEQRRWPTLQLAHFGCPGITAPAALHGGGACSFPRGSEVAAAVEFLQDHPGRTVVATVDLGFNDVSPCLLGGTVYPTCVGGALATIARVLPVVLQELRAAGGPHLQIVGLLHNDPYLASYLDGAAGQRFSAGALSVMNRLNSTLESVYRRAGALVADVPAAFAVGTTTPVALGARRRVPREVATVCTLSWMCDRHNIHLNASGYRAAAAAIASALSGPPG